MKPYIAVGILTSSLSSSSFLTTTVAAASSSTPGVLQYCNRGFCYTKRKEALGRPRSRSSGLNFCTDSGGNVRDCEVFEILGTEGMGDSFEALECKSASCKRMQEEVKENERRPQEHSSMDSDAAGLMDLDQATDAGHVSWKERPKRGRCYDNSLAYEFDCNLVEILDEGLVLIEDLRAGGIFAAQPKSGFSTREGKKQQTLRTPEVITGSGITDPTEDFRTNVSLNLEGL